MHPLAEIEALYGANNTDDNNYGGRGRAGAQPQRDLASVGEPPCTGCPHKARCAARELACEDFWRYVDSNERTCDGPRFPNRAYYRASMASAS